MFAPCKFYDIKSPTSLRSFAFTRTPEVLCIDEDWDLIGSYRTNGFYMAVRCGLDYPKSFPGDVQNIINDGTVIYQKKAGTPFPCYEINYVRGILRKWYEPWNPHKPQTPIYEISNCSAYTHIECFDSQQQHDKGEKNETYRIPLTSLRLRLFV